MTSRPPRMSSDTSKGPVRLSTGGEHCEFSSMGVLVCMRLSAHARICATEVYVGIGLGRLGGEYASPTFSVSKPYAGLLLTSKVHKHTNSKSVQVCLVSHLQDVASDAHIGQPASVAFY